MSPSAACSSAATCRISTCGSPATRPPRRAAICASVSAMSFGGRLAFQRLDHSLGEVDARVRVHRILEDDVVLLLLGERADRPVRLLEHLRQLFVAALVQVFLELAAPALEIAIEV